MVDSNAVAQEKGLEAALAFAENSDIAGKTVNEVIDGLVSKCLAAPKTKTKDLAKQVRTSTSLLTFLNWATSDINVTLDGSIIPEETCVVLPGFILFACNQNAISYYIRD